MNTINTITGDYLMKSHGIDVRCYDSSFIRNSVQKRMSEAGFKNLVDYHHFLLEDDGEKQRLLSSFQIGYTEFFRNPLTFELLKRFVLPSLLLRKQRTKSKEIRIWSAACASGQEAYTLAMILEERSEAEPFAYRIFATDRDEALIERARQGQYHEDEIGNLTLKRAEKWFTRLGETWTVSPKLKKSIEFSQFDLLDKRFTSPPSSIYGDFDLVICANLLFYYTGVHRKMIIDKVHANVAKGGYFVVSESERDVMVENGFAEAYAHSAVFYLK